ncbi:orotidine-5'-phosphate decarboxylase [Sphingomonas sp.]|uniref:orotidine-5'-phosphate decarboxylase n=1 Tax=Sphingomonas sp. TaxID=28214 RepID=UPI0017D10D9B|nr:orotidine-5'-phosphate decarboxylase [Sphingomonas sp.]MBA3510949.1 orotidine-5'-phosphate decarboxylase [Sphingomonas sp.]
MSPIFVAIDTADLARAREIARAVRGVAGGIKLGLEFFAANGPSGVTELGEFGLPIFLDLKLHDIPNTVARAVQVLRPLEPAILTVHAGGGQAMLEHAKAAASPDTKVVAVTVLTSLDDKDLAAAGVGDGPAEQVARLAALAQSAGLDGIVCSGEEVAAARKAWPAGFFVVPGVRPDAINSADQKRIVTPRSAIDDGASILVIGRPITEANDPSAAVRSIAATL